MSNKKKYQDIFIKSLAMNSKKFAMSIGSDVLITHDKYTRTTSSGVKRYELRGIFLKNVKNIKPIFEKTNVDFPKKGVSQYDGIWRDLEYKVEIYNSDEYVVGINKNIINKESQKWKPNQVKFIITRITGQTNGIYFMGNHQPVPASFVINDLGYLEILTRCTELPLVQYKKIE